MEELQAQLEAAKQHLRQLESRPLNTYMVRGHGSDELALARNTVSDLQLKIRIADETESRTTT